MSAVPFYLVVFEKKRVYYCITGPSTHSVEGQYCFTVWRLSSSCFLSSSVTLHGGPACRRLHLCRPMPSRLPSNYSSTVTLQGRPVVLRPLRATPCFVVFSGHAAVTESGHGNTAERRRLQRWLRAREWRVGDNCWSVNYTVTFPCLFKTVSRMLWMASQFAQKVCCLLLPVRSKVTILDRRLKADYSAVEKIANDRWLCTTYKAKDLAFKAKDMASCPWGISKPRRQPQELSVIQAGCSYLPCLWNQLPLSLHQPHSDTSSYISYSPIPSPITSSSSDLPICSSITPSVFHSRLKIYLLHKCCFL